MKTKKTFEMFYFTCNESKIYESFTFWNKLQEKINFFMTFKFIEMHLYSNKAKVILNCYKMSQYYSF